MKFMRPTCSKLRLPLKLPYPVRRNSAAGILHGLCAGFHSERSKQGIAPQIWFRVAGNLKQYRIQAAAVV
jgi:hypothetical protein